MTRAPASAVLLDTCAVIWLATRADMTAGALARIDDAAAENAVMVSPVSAWEIGLMARAGAERGLEFQPDPATWFRTFSAAPGVATAALTADIAVAASQLPEPLRGDQADRLLIATARDLNVPIVTRDARIVDYARRGHVQVVRC